MTATMTPEQSKFYQASMMQLRGRVKKTLEEKGLGRGRMEVLSALTELRQICCHPALVANEYSGSSGKMEMLMDILPGIISAGRRVLIFSQFTRMLDLLKVELDKEKIPYYEITGATPKEVRIERVKAFNGDRTPVFLISLKAGGTGLNLMGANVVIHYDPWWNIAVQNQATDRAHRIGQTKVVTVYKLILKGTIEERILEMQQMKRELAEDILSAENVAATAFSREELLNLLESGISKKDSLPEGPAGGTEAKLPG
jgi:SNF2 family DNA or RNA helicase